MFKNAIYQVNCEKKKEMSEKNERKKKPKLHESPLNLRFVIEKC